MTSPARGRAFSVNRPLTSKRRKPVVENDDYTAFVRRVIRAYSRRVAAGDVDAIADMIQIAADLDAAIHQAAGKSLPNLALLGLEEKVETERDGRFQLRGVGRERLVNLRIEGPSIQAQTIYIVPRDGEEVKALMLERRERMNEEIDPGPALYPPSFRLVANPTRPIVGGCSAMVGTK